MFRLVVVFLDNLGLLEVGVVWCGVVCLGVYGSGS
jgi:hypothetical protein